MLENRMSADEFQVLFQRLKPQDRMALLERLDAAVYGKK
jgi:hypothetical protein